jgi:nitronate monooxygenase
MEKPAWNRRDVLALGAVAGLSTAAAGARGAEPERAAGRALRTRLCALLGIEHPLVQAPMAGVATPELVAAVSEAGGLGLLPGVGVPPDELRRRIRATRSLTSRPFGVNLLLHPGIRHPADPASLPAATLAAVQAVLNRFRERLGLTPTAAPPPRLPALADDAIEVIFEEGVAVFSIGLGRPEPALVRRFQQRGTRVIAMGATPADCRELASAGVDAIVVQGGEAGGHRSTWIKRPTGNEAAVGTLALVPQVARAVEVPVIAAGGIVDGRGLLAALALGAEGAVMGTRFIATLESGAPPSYKQALLTADGDGTVMTDAFTGLWARVLRNEYVDSYRESGAPVLPALLQQAAAADVTQAATARGDTRFYPLYAGQGAGLIDGIPPAGQIVAATVREACEGVTALEALVRGPGKA